jgi:hypothetical protein
MTERRQPEQLKIDSIPVDQLLLDPANPRLEGLVETKDQRELLKALWREMAVIEVALSVAENGFFKEEPLFAIPGTVVDGKQNYYVVEGNRRLAAVKLLLSEEDRKYVKATELPTISATRRAELLTLPVSVYKEKEELWEYFGFRHVNGPKEWDSLSKAAYIAEVRRKYEKNLDVIARKIGDQHSTVERIFRGYVLLEQAEKSTRFHREDAARNRFYFSHLYTAANYPEIQKFLCIDEKSSLKDNPVPKSHLGHLEELMIWLFGSKERRQEPQVKTQFPDLNHLRSIIGNKAAVAALRTGISLQRAYAISLGDERRFEDSLAQAKDALQEAKGTVTTGYRGEAELLSQMESISLLATSVLNEMKAIAARPKAKR